MLQVTARGTLAGLSHVRRPRRDPAANEVEIAVHASGLNFRDVLSLLGQYPGQPPLGAECAGRVVRVGTGVRDLRIGDSVVAMASDSLCDYLTVGTDRVVPLPPSLSLREAATIPVAFLTASLALEELAHVRRGSRVLIHAATGGVGLAAIQIARHLGAELFATASVAKHDTLRQLGIQHVYDSRRPGFADRILDDTAGGGVDVVLNMLGAEFLDENVRVLAADGCYVDITKTAPATVQSALSTRPDVRYHTFDLAAMLQAQPERIQADLRPLLHRFAAGELHPLPSRCFSLADAQSAFRFMRSAQHIGKIVIQPDRALQDAKPEGALLHDPDQGRCDAGVRKDASYLITGGLGGLGLEVAHWLAQRGARHIGLLARRRPTTSEQRRIAQIGDAGAVVECLLGDVSCVGDVHGALETLERGGYPLAGVFHLAGVLDDALITRQSPETLARVFAPKVAGAWNLHNATLEKPLDHFVLFSSAAALLGSAGQANHAAANAFLDALARYRRSCGLPGLSINWGPWSNIGAAAARDMSQRGDLAGIGMLTPAEGIAILEKSVTANEVHVAAVRLEWEQLPTRWKQRPLFDQLQVSVAEPAATQPKAGTFLAAFHATADSQKRDCLLAHLRNLVGKTLGIASPAAIPSDQALSDLGLDSLASLELSHSLEESLETKVSSTLVYDFPTLNDLVGHFVPILQNGNTKSSTAAKPVMPDRAAKSDIVAGQETLMDTHAPDALVTADRATEQCAGADDVLQGIQELSRELDHWNKV